MAEKGKILPGERKKKSNLSTAQHLKGSIMLVFPKSKQLVSSFAIKEISHSCSCDGEPKKRARMAKPEFMK